MKKNKKTRPRLKDIANHLGISIATVSRALRDKLEISEELREKVKLVAKEMNYQPNFMASHLRSQQNWSIGVVIPRINHQYMASIISGIMEEAKLNKYQVIILVTDHSYELELKAVAHFSTGIVDGILICVSNSTKDFCHIEQLKSSNIPFVLFDKDISRINATKVVVDDYTGALRAVEHLIEQGYSNIAHIQDNLTNHSSQKRMKGYFSALKKHGISKNENYVVQIPSVSIENGYKAMEELIQAFPEINAVFCITDEIAIGAMKAALKLGRLVPDNFGVVGFSNWQISSVVSPSLTTVGQPGEDLGKTAVRLLLNDIKKTDKQSDHPESIYTTKIIKTSLIIRESSCKLSITT